MRTPDHTPDEVAAQQIRRLETCQIALRAIVKVLNRFEHYKTFPGKKLAAALLEAAPAFVWNVTRDSLAYRISAHSWPTGALPSTEPFSVNAWDWSQQYDGKRETPETWIEQILRAIAKLDLAEEVSQIKFERAQYARLTALADKIAKAVENARGDALAKLGVKEVNEVSYETRKAFPTLFS
jgi:hypothetical protein